MKALVKAKPEPGIWMSESETVPEIGDDEVLIRIEKTAICGTDIHIYNWDEWAQKTIPVPMIVGHEYGGVIEKIGADVTRVKPGQRVSGEGHVVGVKSRAARAGRFHLDPDTKGIGVNMPGAFAEYMKLPAFNVVPLPDAVPMEIASILDPLGNAVHTALAYDLVGEDVLITGAGPIGIMAAAIARHVGARHIVITDLNEDRLKLAKEVEPTVTTVNVGEEGALASAREKLGIREGFDVGMEMSGAGPAFDQMLDHMIMGGKIAFLGLPAKPLTTDYSKIILKALTIKGVYGRRMFETWYKMLAMLESGLDVTKIITHRFSKDDYAEAFELMASGKSGKIVLDWS